MSEVITTPVRLTVISDLPVQLKVLGDDAVSLSVSAEVNPVSSGFPDYEGEYQVSPSFDKQTLQTKNRSLTDDIVVNEIAVSRTTNSSGGKTVYIGGILDG